jgi:hypothetical protein
LKAHAVTGGLSTNPAQEQISRLDPTPSTAIPSSSSTTPFEPRPPVQMSRQPQLNAIPNLHSNHLPVQRAGQSRTQGLRGTFRRHNVSRSATPTQSPGLNSPLSTFQPSQSTTSTVSTFSFRAPTRVDHPTHGAPHREHNPRQTSTRYTTNTHALTGSAQPPIRTLSQSSTTLTRSGMCNFDDLRITTLMGAQRQRSDAILYLWKT